MQWEAPATGGAFFDDLRDITGKTGMTDDRGQLIYGGGTVVQWMRRCTAIVDLQQWKMRGS
jgi:hypothetical protein